MTMIGLALVVTAITGILLIRVLMGLIRGREFHIDAADVIWYVLALALVTKFFGLIPSYLSSPSTAIARVTDMLHIYYGMLNAMSLTDFLISMATNIGLPIVEAVVGVFADVNLSPIAIAVDVIELLISAVIHYIVNFISILTEVLLLIKLAIVMGKALGALVPYLAVLLVIPRVRTVAVVPVSIYLIIGVALPLGINMAITHPVVNVINTPHLTLPSGLGLADVEVIDELGRPLPAVLHISVPGFGYSETIGLPSGVGLVPLPVYENPRFVARYVVDYVVVLFMRFPVKAYLVPSPRFPTSLTIIRLPLIAVFNGSSLVALFNYTWDGAGWVDTYFGSGYAVINVTTPCSGNLTVTAYADYALINAERVSNCSIKYSITQWRPTNVVSQGWLNDVVMNHELFCQDLKLLLNPSPTYAPEVPPQVLKLLLNTLNESCSGVGDYNESINELRGIKVLVTLACLGRCNDTHVTITVIGVQPYSLNYYALWSGSYVAWLNDSVTIIRNAVSIIGLGPVIAMLVNIAYSSALILGLVGLAAVVPRINTWSKLMSIVRVRLGVSYWDAISTVGAIAVGRVARRVDRSGSLSRYRLFRMIHGFVSRRWYMKHLVRASYWAVRDLPRVVVAPHVALPLLYTTSVARDYLLRRVGSIDNRALRITMRSLVSGLIGPSIVLRPYSTLRFTSRFLITTATQYIGNAINDASRVYSAIKHYLDHRLAFYIAIRATSRGLGNAVIRVIQRIEESMGDPVGALRTVSTELGVLRGLDGGVTSLIARYVLERLITRYADLVNLRVVINNVEVDPRVVLRFGDYDDVVVRVGGRDEIIKAWVIKEFVRIIEKRRW